MWNFILHHCQERNLILQPEEIHVDFEQSMLNILRDVFPSARIMACRFHLAHNCWRKIQSLGLSSEYKDKTCDTAKWLSQFFGICFLPPEEIEDCFVEDIVASAPKDNRCEKFADYVLENYVTLE
ncbi:hypothetical protein KUTeg_011290 [Tegillarca granosa]|uniref:MULE transposase domain-containing protein n=1 Tax=Tegillarca granosa TaxID=220873 RepID=A0ABQ9F177_TEGGR|nr:hypothetical protein KUTeg_011290 [Tegillarca granosa]